MGVAHAGLSWFAIMLGLGGGFGLPLGMPPLPEDPLMARIAPEECLAYTSSAGMATPDAKSANQTEQLLAEPEVQTMLVTLEREIRAGMGRSMQRDLPPGVSSNDVADLAKLLLTRPLAAYVASVQLQPGGAAVRGGLAINFGEAAEKVKTKLDSLMTADPPPGMKQIQIGGEQWQTITVPPNVTVTWGFHGQHFMLAVGEGELEAMLKRAGGNPPAWLAQLRQQLPVERLSTVTFVNLKTMLATFAPIVSPRSDTICRALGLANARALASTTGLDRQECVSRTLLSIDGEPEGLLRLASVKPLQPADLAAIPHDATFAVASCFQPEVAFDLFWEVLDQTEPRPKNEMHRHLTEIESILGLNVRNELLKPLGDSVCLFDSPGEGGLLTGLTLVVGVKDPKLAAETQAKLLRLVDAAQPGSADSRRPGPKVEKLDFAGKQIYTLDPDVREFMLAPSWCLTDKELIVSLYPQAVKAYLSRPAGFKSVAQSPKSAEFFTDDGGLVKVAYCDARRMFDLLYPVALAGVRMAENELRRDGFDLGSAWLPSAGAIRKHLSRAALTVRRTKAGIEIVEQSALPGCGIVSVVPLSMAAFWHVGSISSEASQRMQSANNLKQIALALHNYTQANRTFPPAYTVDQNGKPLLSWRVLILPYLECEDLYKQFHLDEPWDSEHNKQLIAKMPDVYRSPSVKARRQGTTNYLTVRNADALFPGKKGLGFADIRDGTSNTIMTVEVPDAKAVVWTKPDDFTYDKQDPRKGLMGKWPGGVFVGLADGSVRFLPESIDPKTLKASFTRAGGEPVGPDDVPQ